MGHFEEILGNTNSSLRRTLVVSNGLVNPGAQVGHTGVHCWSVHIAVAGTPRYNTHKVPHTAAFTDQRATRVTLE